MLHIILGILLLVMSIFLVVAVLLQQGKSHRLPGAIAGGAETFFGKTKSRSINSVLSKLTTIVAIIFVIVVIIVYISTTENLNFGNNDTTVNDTNTSEPAPSTDDKGEEENKTTDDNKEVGTPDAETPADEKAPADDAADDAADNTASDNGDTTVTE